MCYRWLHNPTVSCATFGSATETKGRRAMTDTMSEREQAVAAFAEVATTEEQAKAAEVAAAINATVQAARQIEVRTADEAEDATEFLARLAGEKKRAEAARRFLVDPLNAHVKAINAEFKTSAVPLEEADRIVREKVLGYRREQERLRAIEQARLDAEHAARQREAEEQRARDEAAARAAAEQAAQEAAQAAEEARAADERRREQLAAAEGALVREIEGMTDDELRQAASKPPMDRARVAATELDRRREARQAQERMAAAAQAESDARAAEEAARTAPAPDVPAVIAAGPAPLVAASGSATARKTWEFTIVDPGQVPAEFMVVDEKKVRAAVRAGVRQIPGVRIEQVDGLAVKAR